MRTNSSIQAWLILAAIATCQTRSISQQTTSSIFGLDTRNIVISDSDNDGLPDSFEILVGLDPFSVDSFEDADGDGRTNLEEYNSGSNPLIPEFPSSSVSTSANFSLRTIEPILDSDADGIPDDWETLHFLNPLLSDADSDADGDGLSNLDEYNSGTDPNVYDWKGPAVAFSPLFAVNTGAFPGSLASDQDGDEMPDWWELKYGLDPTNDDASLDFDGDGISNLEEFLIGGDPGYDESTGETLELSALFALDTAGFPIDTDGDGMINRWEIANNLDPFVNDSIEDPDNDGRSNLEEYNTGTNPLVDDWAGPSSSESELFALATGGFTIGYSTDTDLDGMPDWWELQYGLDPNINDGGDDTDGDGYLNGDEFLLGLSPLLFDSAGESFGISQLFLVNTGGSPLDSDADGLPDSWEITFFGDAFSATPSGDGDLDGHNNWQEYVAGTDPTDANSVFRIINFAPAPWPASGYLIQWSSVTDKVYVIKRAGNLSEGFTNYISGIPATPPWNTYLLPESRENDFFALEVEP